MDDLAGTRIAVVGGSYGGLCAGLALRCVGADVHVYERTAAYDRVGGGIVVQPDFADYLEAFGYARPETVAVPTIGRRFLARDGSVAGRAAGRGTRQTRTPRPDRDERTPAGSPGARRVSLPRRIRDDVSWPDPRRRRPSRDLPDERVQIPIRACDVTLAGTLEAPRHPVGAALLLPGSGPQDRDETIGGQQPLLHLAQGLSARGVATLRCDDRGVGESQGDYLAIDGETLLEDAKSQLAWLADRVPGLPLAVIGHSQGGLFALRLSAEEDRVTCAVLLGAAVRPGMEFMLGMRELMADDAGLTGQDREAYLAHSRTLFAAIAATDDADERAAVVRRIIDDSVVGATAADVAPDFASVDEYVEYAIADALEWEVRELLRSNPASTLAKVTIPVLGLWGAVDRHVESQHEQAAFDRVCSDSCASRVLPAMNHLFQRSATGRIARYPNDGAPMRDPVPSLVAEWIRARRLE